MRLPEAKIKEAIVHPEKLVRQEALLYFADCYSRDAEVMPLAIKAIETYGRSHAFLHVQVLAQLAQTEATVEWVIGELHRREDGRGRRTLLPGPLPPSVQRRPATPCPSSRPDSPGSGLLQGTSA